MITQKQWKEKYSKFIWPQIDRKAYKQSIKQLKNNIFTPDRVNKKRSIIIASNKKEKFVIADNEKQLIEIIQNNFKNVITLPKGKEKMFLRAGVVICNNEWVSNVSNYVGSFKRNKYIRNHKGKNIYTINTNDFFSNFVSRCANKYFVSGNDTSRQTQSRLVRIDVLKNKIKESSDYAEIIEFNFELKKIQEQILKDEEKLMTYAKAMEIVEVYNKKVKAFDYEIELTYDIRKIASQSTETPWRSCMHLDSGENVHYVATGIAAGVFVAYMRNKNKEYARILCKPYVAYVEGKGFVYKWIPSKLYWDSGHLGPEVKKFVINNFETVVRQYLNTIHKPTLDERGKYFVLAKKVYNDREAFAIDNNGSMAEDDKDIYDDATNINVKDFYNFDGAIYFDTKNMLYSIRNGLHRINEQRIPHVTNVITDENLNKFIDSYGEFGKAYQELFELCLGRELTAESIFDIHMKSNWNLKLSDIYYIVTDRPNLTQRYTKLISWRRINAQRILLKYNIDRDEFRGFIYSNLNELNYIQIAIFNRIMQKTEDSITIDQVDSLEKILALKKNSPEKYSKIKNYIDRNCFDGVSFEQNWD